MLYSYAQFCYYHSVVRYKFAFEGSYTKLTSGFCEDQIKDITSLMSLETYMLLESKGLHSIHKNLSFHVRGVIYMHIKVTTN